MYSGMGTRALPRAGFPIRRSRDQRLVSTSPGLIAAAHVLLRLLAPRHPPCALSLLIVKNTLNVAMEFSRCARNRCASLRKAGPEGRSLKTQQRLFTSRSTFVLGEPRAGRPKPSTGGTPTGVIAPIFPRKEVIQPQLPLRLPCYDFTPVTNPTFGGSLPCGLGHRLRVLPASVV